ncbi:oocyte zinc finger protein XlCOF15-like [Bicyclus anynana]|uniref:Oocyte zinc finger protein XlCOF15-like n=1 Tax=Bicyclus anynana TaxID=110368 RepID=A0A6J1P0V0_BICAN|nr:oocyte zinc finger protein XlCOF15-like [Bicyclus anynana]
MVDNQYITPLYGQQCPITVNGHSTAKKNRHNKVKPANTPQTHPTLPDVVYCGNCELNFLNAEEYEKHTKTKCIRKYTCTYCTASFVRNDHLKRHIMSVHTNTKYNICPVCNEDCKNHDALLRHIKKHPNESNFNCRDCHQTYKTLHELVVHESSHIWPECHVCTYCSKVFKRRDHMLRHVKTVHLLQHTACPLCAQKFKRKDHALRHIREKHRMAIPNGGLKGFSEVLADVSQ